MLAVNTHNMYAKEEIQKLIEQIIEDKISCSSAITKAKAINLHLQNTKLKTFIDGELYEKYNDETLPEYRLIWGEPTFEFQNNFNGIIDVRTIQLPAGKHFNGKSTNYRPISFSVYEIESAVKNNKGNTYKILFTPRQLEMAKKYVFGIIGDTEYWQLKRVWWSHSLTSFPTILFKAKQLLFDILLEINNSTMEDDFKEKIFSERSEFDSTFEFSKLIENAKNSIILIDGYVDGTTLKILSSKKENVNVKILTDTKAVSDVLEILIVKFNKQYSGKLEIKTAKSFHDRFLIIDENNFYQIGASIKDLGNKTFSIIKLKEPLMTKELFEKFIIEWNN